MTGPGFGTVYFRADHELVGRVLAEKLRRRMERTGEGDSVGTPFVRKGRGHG